MKAVKLLAVGSSPRLKEAGAHFQEFYGKRGATVELDLKEASSAEEFDTLMELGPEADAILLEPDLGVNFLAKCPVQSLSVSRYRATDVLFFRQNRWEPELLSEEAVRRVIMRQAHHLDLYESAYITGAGVFLRIIAGVAITLGFRRVYLVGEDEADLLEQKEALQKLFMGMDIQPLPAHQLTLQTVGGSLLINTLNLAERSDLAADLAYFNFMRRGGLVMDLHDGPAEQQVLEEAQRADLRIVPPHEFSGQNEFLLAEYLGLKDLAAEREFLNSWFEWLRAKNPTSVE